MAAILLEAYGAVYIEIAKVASSSFKVVFAELLGLDLAGAGGNPHLLDFPSPVGESRRFTFAFVRNPWDRLVSCYRDKIAGEVADFTGMAESGVAYCLAGFDAFSAGMDFAAFVEAVAGIPDEDADEHFRSQHRFVPNVGVDFVGRYEALESDFAHIARKIGLPAGTTLPRLQANPASADYREFYTPRTRELVARRFAEDVARFDYAFDEP